ncbi:MAG: META domain-containing protein [Prevotellaceae bacterium]|jgi:TonB family protein|nr:META domain-containing protein [Prevotellaceae bacterium]
MRKSTFILGLMLMGCFFVRLSAQDSGQDNTDSKTGKVFSSGQVVSPQYEGGEDAMYRFIDSVLVVPQSATDNNVSGRVIVRFFVGTGGEIKAPSVQQGLTPDCNNAALEVVKQMPKWIPAQQNGKNVTGFASVPVIFRTRQIVYEYEQTQAEADYEAYQLENKKWVLVEINGKPIPENVPEIPYFTISMDKKKKRTLTGNASCADFIGKYQWNQKNWKLSFAKVEPTKKRCKSKKVKVIDGEFLSVIKNTREYRIINNQLKIGKMERDRFVSLAVFDFELIKKKK